jgi:hypothetical protein
MGYVESLDGDLLDKLDPVGAARRSIARARA